jgi:membrane fusion protein (multidrug efflux system)
MAATFRRTLRALETEERHPWASGLLLGALLVGWVLWFVLGRVGVYETTEKARLEVANRVHGVSAPVGGRIVETRLALGQDLAAGEVIVRLDSETERLAVAEKRAQAASISDLLGSLEQEIRAEQEADVAQRQARVAAAKEGRAEVEKESARARLARVQLEAARQLLSRNTLSREDFIRARSESEAADATVTGQEQAVARQEFDRMVLEGERAVRVAKLRRESTELKGKLVVQQAEIQRLEHEIDLRSVRAPVAGRVEEIGDFASGSVIRAGERLGAIVPPGAAHAVAWFPVAAAGHLRAGQPARLRLDGFPWIQYGTLAATVARVAKEPTGGSLRVELTLAAAPSSPIPLEHGLPGSVEVAIDQASPAVLFLRATGRLLRGRRTTQPDR